MWVRKLKLSHKYHNLSTFQLLNALLVPSNALNIPGNF
jgi:hypothetical protein